MVSVLVSGLSGPGLSPGQGHCVVFWARHFTPTVPLSTQVYKWMGSGKFNAGSNPAMD